MGIAASHRNSVRVPPAVPACLAPANHRRRGNPHRPSRISHRRKRTQRPHHRPARNDKRQPAPVEIPGRASQLVKLVKYAHETLAAWVEWGAQATSYSRAGVAPRDANGVSPSKKGSSGEHARPDVPNVRAPGGPTRQEFLDVRYTTRAKMSLTLSSTRSNNSSNEGVTGMVPVRISDGTLSSFIPPLPRPGHAYAGHRA